MKTTGQNKFVVKQYFDLFNEFEKLKN